jgi:parvulin-like peptidyl-prolyl isomerase
MALGRRVRRIAALGVAGLAIAPPAFAQQIAPKALPKNVAADQRSVVAFFHGNVPVYRDELSDYLLARGGMDKVELLVNRRMIEVAASRAGVSVTPEEIHAGLEDDLRGAKVELPAFKQYIRERYGKSIFEWEQDVIRPRLLMGKMCHKGITLSPDEVRKAFETRFGERRTAQLIVWPKGEDGKPKGLPEAQMAKARENAAEFTTVASAQPDQGLRETRGHINPVGRHIDGEDPKVEEAIFSLKDGEISPWIETKTNFTLVRCTGIMPADPAITFDKVKTEVEKEVFDRKLTAAIPGKFAEIKKQAEPTLTKQVPLPENHDPKNPPVRLDHPDPRVLAVVYGTINITREDLGDFLIVRGGFEKIELLVNKRLIEWECAKRGVTIDAKELEAAKVDYVKRLGIENVEVKDFVKHVLPKRGMTEATWVEDVVRPELMMSKLCRQRVKVEAEDVQKAFETKYGEQREAKIIVWPREQARVALRQWDEARKSDAEFDRVARSQSDPNVASAAGRVAPVGRHPEADNTKVADTLFQLKLGEVSQLFETPAGIMCVKLIAIIPPKTDVKLEQVKEQLTKEVYERKVSRDMGTLFAEMRQTANPDILLRGPTTSREFEEGNRQLLQQAVGGDKK